MELHATAFQVFLGSGTEFKHWNKISSSKCWVVFAAEVFQPWTSTWRVPRNGCAKTRRNQSWDEGRLVAKDTSTRKRRGKSDKRKNKHFTLLNRKNQIFCCFFV